MVLPYVAAGEVTTLKHELGDDTVEAGALVVEGLAGAASALLAGAESAEVLGGPQLASPDSGCLSSTRYSSIETSCFVGNSQSFLK